MDDKPCCQSCGMPIAESFHNYGTNADGKSNPVFCKFCFLNGNFTNPNQTLEEMIVSSVKNMTQDQRMTHDQAEPLARKVIPTLARWRR